MAFLEDTIYIVVRDKAGCEELFMNHIKTQKDDIGMKGEMSATYCLLQDQECNQNRTMQQYSTDCTACLEFVLL